MSVVGPIVWFGLGAIGAMLMWMSSDLYVERRELECPSPRAITGIALTSCLGAFVFIAGAIIFLVEFTENRSVNRDSWWRRPICRWGRRA